MKRYIKAYKVDKKLSENQLYLYHATKQEYLDSILTNGLLVNSGNKNWSDMYVDDGIFLAFNAKVASDYTSQVSDNIVILKVRYDKLDGDAFEYDWNNYCEYTSDINSCKYLKNIPAQDIEVVKNINSEPEFTIYNFEDTDMGWRILDTFDEEVESNKERED